MEEVQTKLWWSHFWYTESDEEEMIFKLLYVKNDGWSFLWSMSDCEMVGAHFGLQQIWLRNHAVYIDLHYFLHEMLVIQSAIVGVFVEKHPKLIFLEDAAKFIETFFESIEISVSGIC